MKAICAAAVLVWAARGADPPPSADEAALLVRGAREVAMSYARTLPDFECTQIVRREYRGPRIARRLLDVLTIRLTYHAQQDHHELLLVDGHKTSATYDSLVGATGEGEFGATLSSIFRPVGGAEFQWRSWTTHHGRPAAAFHYTMSRERGRYGMVFQSEQTGMLTATVGFRGEVVIDRDTFGILRLTYEMTDVPDDFPIRASSTRVEYGFEDIGGRRFLLPVRAETDMATATTATWNIAEFRGYRKFETESKVSFGDEK